jgi:hypothetical protein
VQDALARDERTGMTGDAVGSGAMGDVLFGLLFPAGSAGTSGRSQHPGRMARDHKRGGHPMAARASDQDLTNFDVFVLALSVLSIVNIALAIAPLSAAVHNVILIVDAMLCVRKLGERR